jgi:hypothetical protein
MQIGICFNVEWSKTQPLEVYTCFNELKFLIYDDEDIMSKETYASLHMAYGHV